MDFLSRLTSWLLPRRQAWTLEDISHFVDAKKYPASSPVQNTIKSTKEFMQTSILMGLIGTLGTATSLRMNVYGTFGKSPYAKATVGFATFLTLSSILLLINYFKAKSKNSPMQLMLCRSKRSSSKPTARSSSST